MKAQHIAGTVALVTGANRGIGRALTAALLDRGAKKVYATTRDPEALHALRDDRLVVLRLDVTDPLQILAVADAAPDVELVFNNAGVALSTGIVGPTVVDQARREMEVNYFGPLQLLQRLAPTLARNGGGAVVNVGSVAGLTSVPFLPTYSASKAALHSLTQAARMLLASAGTSVFGVYAGPVDTDMVRELALPKSAPRDVASAILDGVEAGHEDIYPDPFSADFGKQFGSSPKAAERQIAAMVATNNDLTTTITVDQTPEQVFAAINQVRGWWSGEIEGSTDKLGDEFSYRYGDLHYSKQRIIESAPGKRVVWLVVDSNLSFVADKTEWNGTRITFDISKQGDQTQLRFTHVGLARDHECFDECSNAWGSYIQGSLRRLIATDTSLRNPLRARS